MHDDTSEDWKVVDSQSGETVPAFHDANVLFDRLSQQHAQDVADNLKQIFEDRQFEIRKMTLH